MRKRSLLLEKYHSEYGKKIGWMRFYITAGIPLLLAWSVWLCVGNAKSDNMISFTLNAVICAVLIFSFILLLPLGRDGYAAVLASNILIIVRYIAEFVLAIITSRTLVSAADNSDASAILGIASGFSLLFVVIGTIIAISLFSLNIAYFVRRKDLFNPA